MSEVPLYTLRLRLLVGLLASAPRYPPRPHGGREGHSSQERSFRKKSPQTPDHRGASLIRTPHPPRTLQ